MFFEDVNMLLPIETFHDEATNTVYTTTDRMGTYCLVDMEIFLDNLDKQLNVNEESEAEIEVQPEKSGAMSKNSNDADGYACCTVNKSDAKSKAEDDFDAVFMIDCRSVLSAGEYALIQKSIIEASDTIFIKSPNARVRIVIMNSIGGGSSYRVMKLSDIKSIEPSKDNSFFTNIDDVYSVLSKLPEMTEDGSDCNLTGALRNVCEYAKAVRRKTFCFCYFKAKDTLYQSSNVDSYDILYDIRDNLRDISISAICDENANGIKYGYAIDMCNMTKGFFVDGYDDSSKYILSHIYLDNGYVKNGYKAIVATGYKTVQLNSSLQQNYEWYQQSAHYDVYRDTDLDGLCDYEEIKFASVDGRSLVNDSNPNNVQLLTFGEIVEAIGDKINYSDEGEKHFYVINGLKRYMEITGEHGLYPDSLWNVRILPINSDPTSEDGDKDGISDYRESLLELSPLQSTVVEIDGSLIDDSNCIGNTKDFDEISFYDGFVYSEEVSKGEYSDDSAVFKKPALKFTRLGNSTFQFLITPNKNSDYVISYDGICDITVEEVHYFVSNKPLKEDEIIDVSDKGMTMLLKSGKSYLITVNNNSSQLCTVRIRQDNWVYAPNGGIFESDNITKYTAINGECNIPTVRAIFFCGEYTDLDDIKNKQFIKETSKEYLAEFFTWAVATNVPYDEMLKKLISKGIVKESALSSVKYIRIIFILKTLYDVTGVVGDYVLTSEFENAQKENNGNIFYIEDLGLSESGISYTYAHWYSWNNEKYINKYQGVALMRGKIYQQFDETDTYWIFD